MTTIYKWIETAGGPHLVMPGELLGFWRGNEGWGNYRDPADTSDYAHLCRAMGRRWLSVMPYHTGEVLILDGEGATPVAWIADADGKGGLVLQWIGVDDEASIPKVLESREMADALNGTGAEEIQFATGLSGVLHLFDSAERGNALGNESEVMRLVPGTYRVRAAYFEIPAVMMVVRQFRLGQRHEKSRLARAIRS